MPDTAVQTVQPSAWQLMPCTLDKGPAGNVAIGLITLSNDTVIEPELYTFLPRDGVAVYASRIPMAPTVSEATLKDMQRNLSRVAAEILPDRQARPTSETCCR